MDMMRIILDPLKQVIVQFPLYLILGTFVPYSANSFQILADHLAAQSEDTSQPSFPLDMIK